MMSTSTYSPRLVRLLLAALVLSVLCVLPRELYATAYTVNVLSDNGTTPRGVGSGTTGDLRYCITQANDGATGSTHTITFTVTGTLTLAGHELVVNSDLTITGPGEAQLTITANKASRVFFIAPSHTVTFSGLTMTQGNGKGNDAGGTDPGGNSYDNCGGAVLNAGSVLTLSHCTFTNNAPPQFTSMSGGAIYNRARGGDATLHVNFCTITGNSAPDFNGGGGGIESFAFGGIATLDVFNSTISQNTTKGEGGGILNSGLGDNSPARATISNCTISQNTADGFDGGGGICSMADSGGGVSSMTVTNSVISGNTLTGNSAGGGGGILHGGGAFCTNTMTVQNCTISGNTSNKTGGGISNYGRLSTTTMTVSGCTISGNTASTSGGGLFNYASQDVGTLQVNNCTIANNDASQRGGGIYNFTDGNFSGTAAVCTVANSTIAGNSALSSGAAIANDKPQDATTTTTSVTLANTILALNPTGANYAATYGTATSLGFNLCDDNTFNKFSAGTGDLINTPAGLRVNGTGKPLLQDNGGATKTIGLVTGSAALDAGKAGNDPLTGQPALTDQRSTARPYDKPGVNNAPGGDGSDIGAFESGAGPVITISASPAGFGTVSGGGQVEQGDSTTVVATANAGYRFVNWTDGGTVASTTPSYTFTANAARTLVANFRVATPPSIVIESPVGHGLTSGSSTVALTPLAAGANKLNASFKVKNSGELDLTLTSLTFTGPDRADFSVTASPSSVVAGGGSTNFVVTCAPTRLGDLTATLQIVSNTSGGPSPFLIGLTASAADTKAPVLTVQGPRPSVVTGPFDLQGTVGDNFRLASFTVKVNGVVLPLDQPLDFSSNAVQNWRVTGVVPENGSNTIVIEAVDLAGRKVTNTRTVSFVNNRPALAGIFTALLVPAGAPGLETAGFITLTVTARGTFTGKVLLDGASLPIRGLLNNAGAARFAPALLTTLSLKDPAHALGALALDVSSPGGLRGTLSTQPVSGTVLANIAGQVAPYTKADPVPASLLNQPVGSMPTKGVYTVAFLAKTQNPVRDLSLYPQGDGYAALTLTNLGSVSLTGKLADGAIYRTAGKLRADGSVALFTPLYAKHGAYAGELSFASLTDSDVTGAGFLWLRPQQATQKTYPAGWPDGIRNDAVGTKYARPASLDFGQGAADPTLGNASLKFTDGLLSGPVSKAVNIDPATGAVKLIPAGERVYKCSLAATTGVLSGSFTHTDGTKPAFAGILLNKGAFRGGYGYFLSTPTPNATGQGGSFTLDPAGP